MKVQILRIAVIVSIACVCIEAQMRKMAQRRMGTAKRRMRMGQRRRVSVRGSKASESLDWSYEGKTGPDNWAKKYPGCGAPLQTPIDLPAFKDLTPVGAAPLKLKNYDKIPKNQTFLHDGFSGKMVGTYKGKKTPSMSGGGLNGTFFFDQFHFHWAESNDLGSEHTVDGKASPLEIHLVHKGDNNTLAVLAVLTSIDEENPRNSVLFPLWNCFVDMEKPGSDCELGKKKGIAIEKLLPSDTSRFYRYVGSTTTPPCLANVIWTVLEQKVKISAADVALLRTWLGADGNRLLNNYRPIQDTEGREILGIET